jgi:hypothetical protein
MNLQLDPGRELDLDLGLVVDADNSLGQAAGEHVAAARAVVGEEVQVTAGQVEPAVVCRKAEADDDAGDVAFLERALSNEHIRKRRIGPVLGADGAEVDMLEATVDPHGGACGRGRQELPQQCVDVLGDAHVELGAGLKGGDDGERAATGRLGPMCGPVLAWLPGYVGRYEELTSTPGAEPAD